MSRKGGVFMRVHLPGTGGMTMVENTFIDQFMPAASGDFVKIYLYLLRCVQEGHTDVTISQVADALNYTEADVKRAMGYWKKMQMLDFDGDDDGAAAGAACAAVPGTGMSTSAVPGTGMSASAMQGAGTSASAVPGTGMSASAMQGTGTSASAVPGTGTSASAVPGAGMPAAAASAGGKITEFRPVQPQKAPNRDEIRSLIFVAENYLGRLLTSTEQRTLLYFLNDLGMDSDLIVYLLEYCISNNHTSFHYIQKVAQNWTEKGIRTPEQARREGSAFRSEYYEIFRALGIQGRTPTPAEVGFMDRWLNEYGFTPELICQACERTILQIGKAQFSYTDSILRSWHENNVRSLEDVKKLDELHAQTARQVQSRRSAAPAASDGRFVNFEPSGNDWDDLAMQIMDAQDEDPVRKSQES